MCYRVCFMWQSFILNHEKVSWNAIYSPRRINWVNYQHATCKTHLLDTLNPLWNIFEGVSFIFSLQNDKFQIIWVESFQDDISCRGFEKRITLSVHHNSSLNNSNMAVSCDTNDIFNAFWELQKYLIKEDIFLVFPSAKPLNFQVGSLSYWIALEWIVSRSCEQYWFFLLIGRKTKSSCPS